MLTSKLTEQELQFCESWNHPQTLMECLFHNFDDLGSFTEEEKFGELRLYQFPMISYESLIDFEATAKYHNLSEKETFNLHKNVGDCYNFGGRRFGKSLCSLKLDMAISALNEDNLWSAFCSIDEKRIRGVLDSVAQAMHYHPIFKAWNFRCLYKPEIKFYSPKNNWKLQGVNMLLGGKTPGSQWYSLHVGKIWGDEMSFESQEIFEKRQEAISELGAVERLCGMTNYTRHSPIGKVFYDPVNKEKVINLPQFCNPYWSEKEKEDRIKIYSGENSINYKVFVRGEVVEDGVSEFDIERVSQCYLKRKTIKNYEINKETFARFRNLVIVEKPKNAERMLFNADVGDNQTEIIIHSEIGGGKYNYLYNITLYNLILDQQEIIFKYLIEKISANVIGIDCGDAFGRVLADHLEKTYSKDNVVRYAGASKINVGFEKDEKGNIILKSGKPVYKREYMSEWSIRRLKALLYEQKVNIPQDYKFDMQINSVMGIRSGTRVRYKCVCEEDHLFDAWRVFAISEWLKYSFNMTPRIQKEWGIGICDRL